LQFYAVNIKFIKITLLIFKAVLIQSFKPSRFILVENHTKSLKLLFCWWKPVYKCFSVHVWGDGCCMLCSQMHVISDINSDQMQIWDEHETETLGHWKHQIMSCWNKQILYLSKLQPLQCNDHTKSYCDSLLINCAAIKKKQRENSPQKNLMIFI